MGILISSLQKEKLRQGEIKGLHPYSDSSLGDTKAQEGIILPKQGNLVLTSERGFTRLLAWTGGLEYSLALRWIRCAQ